MPDRDPTQIADQIEELLKDDQLTTKTGLRLSMSTVREALLVISDIDKKVSIMWQSFGVIKWGMGILGTSLLLLIFSLITGQAHIVFGVAP